MQLAQLARECGRKRRALRLAQPRERWGIAPGGREAPAREWAAVHHVGDQRIVQPVEARLGTRLDPRAKRERPGHHVAERAGTRGARRAARRDGAPRQEERMIGAHGRRGL